MPKNELKILRVLYYPELEDSFNDFIKKNEFPVPDSATDKIPDYRRFLKIVFVYIYWRTKRILASKIYTESPSLASESEIRSLNLQVDEVNGQRQLLLLLMNVWSGKIPPLRVKRVTDDGDDGNSQTGEFSTMEEMRQKFDLLSDSDKEAAIQDFIKLVNTEDLKGFFYKDYIHDYLQILIVAVNAGEVKVVKF